ncbi:MAG: hypothetical protein K2H60_16565 [Muribaculaceae bacterium]|nr:hypothetical protein [Muribaculaceae bacterium]
MNNHRLLTGLLSIILLSGEVCAYSQSVITLEEIFESAETNSSQLQPSFAAQTEAEREISVARAGRLTAIWYGTDSRCHEILRVIRNDTTEDRYGDHPLIIGISFPNACRQ